MRPQDTFDVIVHAHRVLRRFVDRGLSDQSGDTLRGDLEALSVSLPVHFEFEERSGGFLTQIQVNGAATPQTVQRLIDEHRELLRVLDELLAADDTSLRDRIRAFATQLRDHEQEERRLGALAH